MSAYYSTVSDTCKINADHITLIANFFKKPFPIDPTRRGLDGIDVGVNYRSDRVTQEFGFWSPDSSSNESKLAILLINIMNNSFKKPNTINYIEQLEQYFPHKLGLKKIADKPLTYKLYGTVSVNDQKQLKDFFRTLIDKKEVYIDMSNFSRMGKMFYPDVKDLMTKNANIYWLNLTPTGLKQLREVGVADKNIITK
ncbi:hypothetical protein [Mucilaginibacter myungsuensis]|uniref:Uncharacterized protein n=1 Tax=Mucilaginibacter myungsuensis TaxID=649104 RepID=A0A929KWG7_9SPHI|nr:hypothetical protein [Mucilaginibacter myungsuensis]MBE9662442.1 hypothetical protein [Mucilaginibacter myungsuensis]MDN3599121.1 hypothetical protein [Mucilaginibacter myungsuensis]